MSDDLGFFSAGATPPAENRWSQRRLVIVPVEVFEHGSLITSALTRDISLGGVFLSGLQSNLQFDHDFDLYFSLGLENPTKHKLKGKVVRSSDQGAGLMFKDFDTNAFRALQEVMRVAPVQTQV